MYGKLTRRQKAMTKKFHGKILAILGTEYDDFGNRRDMTRTLDIYFDDIQDIVNLIYDWKYESWMNLKEKFDGIRCRGWFMTFDEYPLMRIRPVSGDGRNTNKSFRGSVDDTEVRWMFSSGSSRELTEILWERWQTSQRINKA